MRDSITEATTDRTGDKSIVAVPKRRMSQKTSEKKSAVASNDPTFYQCYIALSGIKPSIWRRIVIPSNITIAQLHSVLQVLMGWSGESLHRFRIRGKEYGINYIHGIWFRDDAKLVRLSDLRLREGQRFTYEYDLIEGWKCNIRIEKVFPADATDPEREQLPKSARLGIPVCIAAERHNPPEEVSSPESYMEWLDRYYDAYALRELQDSMYLVACRVQAFLDGGEQPTREDEEFMEALDRMERHLEHSPETYPRGETNTALRKLARLWAKDSKTSKS